MSRFSTSSAVPCVGARLATAWRRVACSASACDDVERRQRADFDARPVVFDELGGQRQRALGDFFGLDREDEIPIRVAHVGDRPDDRRAQRRLGHLLIDLRDLQLRAGAVDAEVAQQRLT